MIFVTGGAGFIGSNFIAQWLESEKEEIVNIDNLTYSGNLENLKSVEKNPLYKFFQVDVCDQEKISELFSKFKPRAFIHFAAESHVDRSIKDPMGFIRTNVIGTFSVLEASRIYWNTLAESEKNNFRFFHISTDEVYGSLSETDPAFEETKKYEPNSPYSATKAGSDHLVRAYGHTYGLPVLVTNCSNNYGAFQFPEKLIPLVICNAIEGKNLPIYGDGKNIRDWLYVEDHCEAIRLVLKKGRVGEVYNVGGNNELANIDVVTEICKILDEVRPKVSGKYSEQIVFVKDRLGHDRRYAVCTNKIANELGFVPKESFMTGLRKTVEWYLNNPEWISHVQNGDYKNWIKLNY